MPICSSGRSASPLLPGFMDYSMWYPSMAYYYRGYNGSLNEWEDYPRYVNTDGVEMSPLGFYGGMYHHGYGYASYGAYHSPGSLVPTMGYDGQVYGTQHYQYPLLYYQSSTPSDTGRPPNQAQSSQLEIPTSAATDQPPLAVDTAKANSNGTAKDNAVNNNVSVPPKLSHHNPIATSNGSYNIGVLPGGHPYSGYWDLRFGFDGMGSTIPWCDGPIFPDGQHKAGRNGSATSTFGNSMSKRNQNVCPFPDFMGLNGQRPTSGLGRAAPGFLNMMYTNSQMHGQYSNNALRNSLGFELNSYGSKLRPCGVGVGSKHKPSGQGNGHYDYCNVNSDGLNELNKGPRSGHFKNYMGLAPTITTAVKGQDLETIGQNEDSSLVPDGDQFNRADFPEKYEDAKFFVIKSYSEDDIHKSIKYGVWASTHYGNKMLNASYQEVQEKAGRCPIFLFFSVNTSGQFVGVAEMIGPVDFNKTVEYWQQDKWNGCFPVKWHIVKDVPNSILKHITLENNENRPVTNSRDTQEVMLEQGLQMLNLFKGHVSQTSILDDLGFYDTRQKVMHERKMKRQQFQKQIFNGKATDAVDENEAGQNEKARFQKPLEVDSVLKKGAVHGGLGEQKQLEENGVAAVAFDVPKVTTESVPEKHIVINVVANGC